MLGAVFNSMMNDFATAGVEWMSRALNEEQVNAMAKRTTRTTTRDASKTSKSSVTYASGPASVADQATDMGAPDIRIDDAGSPGDRGDDATRNESMGSEPSEEEIRMRAYRRYLERGGSDGQDFDDWLQAEKELKQGS
jgi:DUF2934 family protein